MTTEEIFKLGWEHGFSDGGEYDCRMFTPSADRAWIIFRRSQIVLERGEDVATEYYNNAIDKLVRDKKDKSYNHPEKLKCPICDGEMTPRNSHFGKFWGCKSYPKCTGTRDVNGDSKDDRARRKHAYDLAEGHEDIGPDPSRESNGVMTTFKKG